MEYSQVARRNQEGFRFCQGLSKDGNRALTRGFEDSVPWPAASPALSTLQMEVVVASWGSGGMHKCVSRIHVAHSSLK